METFFKSLGKTGIGQFSISVSFHGTDCAVSLLPKASEGDNALKAIRPFTLKGSIEEIDTVFLERLGKPMQETKVLFDNANGYLSNLKKAEEKTKMANDRKEKKKKANHFCCNFTFTLTWIIRAILFLTILGILMS